MQKPTSEFNREVANVIWLKLKGIKIPENYSTDDIDGILVRYWHRAMESE